MQCHAGTEGLLFPSALWIVSEKCSNRALVLRLILARAGGHVSASGNAVRHWVAAFPDFTGAWRHARRGEFALSRL